MRRIRACIVVALLLLVPVIAHCQDLPPSQDPLHVYLITFGPGSDPWEKFGHDCIAFKNDYDPANAVTYNWGVFDFGQGFSGFVTFGWHFLQGRLLYSMQSDYMNHMLAEYKSAGRSILIQELRMTRVQKLSLAQRLEANDTEANRYYLYDYFKKNCATMCRDEIDQSVEGQVETSLNQIPTGTTYRWHDQRATADCLWLYTFLDFALGHGVDTPLSAWQESFLPGKLALHLRSVMVRNEAGHLVPLVKGEKQLSPGTFMERDVPPRSFFYYFLAAGIVTGLIFAGLAGIGGRYWPVRWIFNLAVMAWSLLMGMLGALLSYAWFSDHLAAKWNENWLQGNPISLLLIVLAPMAFRWPTLARRVAFVVLGLSILGLIAKVLPWFWQVNGTIIAFALPVHAGIAWGITRLTCRQTPPVVPMKKPNAEAVDAA